MRSRGGASTADAGLEHRLALLGALAALALGPAEEVGELLVAVALGVLHVRLEAQGVVQALLGEPDDVVVLVLGPGDLAAFFAHDASTDCDWTAGAVELPGSAAGHAEPDP